MILSQNVATSHNFRLISCVVYVFVLKNFIAMFVLYTKSQWFG